MKRDGENAHSNDLPPLGPSVVVFVCLLFLYLPQFINVHESQMSDESGRLPSKKICAKTLTFDAYVIGRNSLKK